MHPLEESLAESSSGEYLDAAALVLDAEMVEDDLVEEFSVGLRKNSAVFLEVIDF